MRKILLLLALAVFLAVVALDRTGTAAMKDNGGLLFHKHCLACHPRVSRLKSVKKNLVAAMRNPPAYMPSFNEEKISDEDAKKVADYIYQSSE